MGQCRIFDIATFLSFSQNQSCLFLLGRDAAHSVHPHAGMGLNVGYADVRSLATQLSKAAETGADLGSDLVLADYSRERIMENLPLMASIEGLKFLMDRQHEGFVLARTLGLRTFNLLGPVKGTIMKYAMASGTF